MLTNAQKQARWREKQQAMKGQGNMIRALIKGNAEQAADAMIERCITGNLIKSDEKETFLDIPCHHLDKLARWYCEPTACEQGKGYPAGTLLFFSLARE